MEQNHINHKFQYKKEKLNSFLGFFIKNFRFSYLLIIAIILLGTSSLFSLPRESDPEVQIPFGMVTTIYSGASPEDIEYLITNKLESEIEKLEDIKEITSNSGLGFSSIFVEFDAEIEMKEATRKLRDAVDSIKYQLPSEANDPMVTEIRANDFPLATFSLFGNYSNSQLQDYADLIQKELENIKGVSKAPILGELKKEYQIIIDPQKIQGYKINISQVVATIASSNIALPLGNIEIDGYKYNLRTEGRFTEARVLNDLVIVYYQDQPIYLKDIAEVKDTFKDQATISRLAVQGSSPQNTMSLQVYKKTGGNILKIVDDAKNKIEELKETKKIPPDLDIKITNDNSVYIRKDLNTLGGSALQTILLIILIIFIAMGWKESSLAIFVIPLTFLSSFAFMKYIGFTLNSMTTFALVLSLGLLVDTAIVIMEGIFDGMEHKGLNAQEAVLYSIATFKWALISGTMTTISAFAPMLLVSGVMGEYLKYIPITVSFTLGASLFISLAILPTLASRILKKKKNRYHEDHQKKKNLWQKISNPEIPLLEKFLAPIKKEYEQKLMLLIKNKKKMRKLIFVFTILFLIATSFPITGLMKIEMFPEIDFDYFFINIETPAGTIIEETNQKTKLVEKYVSQIKECENYVTTIGASQGWYMMTDETSNKSNLANITVNLIDAKERDLTSHQLVQRARDYFAQNNIEDMKISIPPMAAGPPSGAPVEVRITGEDLNQIIQISQDVKKILSEIEGPIDIKDNLENATGQFIINLDQSKLNYYNLSVNDIALFLRQSIYGIKASEVTKEGQSIDIKVKYDQDNFNNIEDINNMLLTTSKGPISLSTVAQIKLEPSLVSINHRNTQKIVNISSSLKEGYNANQVFQELEKKLENYNLPRNYFIDYGGEFEDIQKSFTEMFTSLIVAIILISAILILQFNSYRQPLIIMFMLPLSLIGVIFGLTILRLNFSITAFIGVLSLAGIVVNDAIVLISRINENIRECGIDFYEAIHEATVSRLQPIILTTATTVIGLLPLALRDPMWAGLSYSIIFGLSFATVLTLFVVPSLYTILEYKNWKKDCQEKFKNID